jgi:hypothetical protein
MSDAQDRVDGMDPARVPVTPEMHFGDFDPIEAARLAKDYGCMILRGDDTCRVRFVTMVEDMIERGVLEGVVSMLFDAEGNLVDAGENDPSAPVAPTPNGIAWAFVFTPGADDPASGTVTEFGEAGKVEFPLVAARDSFGNFLGLVSPDSGSADRAAAE